MTDKLSRLTSAWQVKEAVTVTATGGGNAPGRWALTTANDRSTFLDTLVNDEVVTSKVEYNLISLSTFGNDPEDYDADVKVDLWAMGTYVAQYEITGVLSGTTYTDSGTYTFHVGPVAELEVRDGGANPQVAGSRRAYTIEAINNGPSDAGGVQVTLTGAPEGAVAEASQGDYYEAFCGADGLCEGIWTVGDLESVENRALLGKSEAATLTITAEGDPIRATIESTRDYTVCVDSNAVDVAASSQSACEAVSGNSWQSAEYYDYVTDNNTAQITSRTGTGRGHPEAPSLLRARKYATAVLLDWEPVETLNGYPVTHYEVERQRGTRWEFQSNTVTGTMYADLNPGQQLRSYRVRAVNRFGVVGPWSWPSAGDSPQVRTTAPRDFTATVSLDGTRIDLNWLPAATEGATVDRHDLEWRQRTSDDWDCLRLTPAGPCLGGLPGDATRAEDALPVDTEGVGRYYRIRAVFDDGVAGAWATTRAVNMVPGFRAASRRCCRRAATRRC